MAYQPLPDRRSSIDRRQLDDRRSGVDQRSSGDRRHAAVVVSSERRTGLLRRAGRERRV